MHNEHTARARALELLRTPVPVSLLDGMGEDGGEAMAAVLEWRRESGYDDLARGDGPVLIASAFGGVTSVLAQAARAVPRMEDGSCELGWLLEHAGLTAALSALTVVANGGVDPAFLERLACQDDDQPEASHDR